MTAAMTACRRPKAARQAAGSPSCSSRRRRSHSQTELAGCSPTTASTVTQATLSRDLEELGAVEAARVRRRAGLRRRRRGRAGRVRARSADATADRGWPGCRRAAGQRRGQRQPRRRCARRPAARTSSPPRSTAAGLPDVLGTIAGDDTVLLVTRDPTRRRARSPTASRRAGRALTRPQPATPTTEGAHSVTERVVLAYSGGLDTSVAIGWIAAETGAEVIAVAADVGQGGEDMDVIRQRALDCGAVESIVVDAKRRVRRRVLPAGAARPTRSTWTATRWSRRCPGRSSSSTWSPPRASTAPTMVAHGCTGKGNDQVRFEVGIGALAPDLRCIAPVRDSGMTRDKAIAFAEERNLPIDVTKSSPYSIDQNVWGRAVETGFLEDVWNAPIEDVYSYTQDPAVAARRPTRSSSPSTTACRSRSTASRSPCSRRSSELNARAGAQGVGRLDMVEDRLVGIKSREVYEAPGAHRADHRAPGAGEPHRRAGPAPGSSAASSSAGPSWSTTACGSRRCKRALDAFVDEAQRARHRRHPDDAARRPRGRHRPPQRRARSTTTTSRPTTPSDTFDQSLAKGFVELWGLPSRIAAAARPAAGGEPATQRPEPRRADPAVGRPVRRRPGRGAGRAVGVASTSTGGWRPYDLPARGRTPGCCTGPGCSTTTSSAGMLGGAGRARPPTSRPARSARRVDDEDVHTALERGLLERVGAARRQAARRPLAATTRSPPTCGCTCATHARDVAGRLARPRRTRWSAQAEAHLGRRHARHDPPAARPAGAASPTTCWPTCRRFARDVDRLRDWDARAAVSPATAPARWPARRCRWTPSRSPPNSASPAPPPTRSTRVARPRLRRRVPLRRRDDRRRTCRGSARRSCSGPRTEFSLGHARRRLLHRLVDHAAEEEPGRRRARPRQGRPADRQPDRRCWPRSRACRWPTTATCRRTRSRCSTRSTRCALLLPALTGMIATMRFDTERLEAARAGGLRAGDRRRRVAGAARGAVPRRPRDRRRRGRRLRARPASSSTTSPTTTLAAISPAPDAGRPRGAHRARRAGRPARRPGARRPRGSPSSWPGCGSASGSSGAGRRRPRWPGSCELSCERCPVRAG